MFVLVHEECWSDSLSASHSKVTIIAVVTADLVFEVIRLFMTFFNVVLARGVGITNKVLEILLQ